MSATLFHNGRILTMDPARPHAAALLVRDGRIAHAGDAAALPPHGDAARHDLGGATLLPAFIDAHCHMLAAAAALRSIDCSPDAVRSIRDIQARLRDAAATARAGAWLRASGYDETALEERRHPTCRDLDDAVPHLPVRLLHRSGHAVVLNTLAMRLAGIAIDTEEPPGGYVERFHDTGEPTGLLLEMNDAVDRVVPPLPYDELAGAVAEVSQRFLAAGVTALCDATHTNGVAEWQTFARLHDGRRLPLRVSLMEGLAHAGDMPDAERARLSRGHVKIMISEIGGRPSPDDGDLRRAVAALHAEGRDVAVHAVEERAVAAAIDAIEAAVAGAPREHRHRIEHAALLPPDGAARIARLGITVVTQPGWVREHGDRYLRDVPRDKHGRLYPIGDLLRAGVRVAASSDAPVGDIDVLDAVRAAVERRTASGAAIGHEQAITFEQALAMWTRESARAAGLVDRGTLAPRMAADMVLLAGDPPHVAATFMAGERVYARG